MTSSYLTSAQVIYQNLSNASHSNLSNE